MHTIHHVLPRGKLFRLVVIEVQASQTWNVLLALALCMSSIWCVLEVAQETLRLLASPSLVSVPRNNASYLHKPCRTLACRGAYRASSLQRAHLDDESGRSEHMRMSKTVALIVTCSSNKSVIDGEQNHLPVNGERNLRGGQLWAVILEFERCVRGGRKEYVSKRGQPKGQKQTDSLTAFKSPCPTANAVAVIRPRFKCFSEGSVVLPVMDSQACLLVIILLPFRCDHPP